MHYIIELCYYRFFSDFAHFYTIYNKDINVRGQFRGPFQLSLIFNVI